MWIDAARLVNPPRTSERDWYVYQQHVTAGRTFGDIAREIGVSRARVQQIIERTGRLLRHPSMIISQYENLAGSQ